MAGSDLLDQWLVGEATDLHIFRCPAKMDEAATSLESQKTDERVKTAIREDVSSFQSLQVPTVI